MDNIYNIVSDLHIGVGETQRMNCPICKGRKTFTVTNNMGSLVWNCYKASCDVSGGKRVAMNAEDIKLALLNRYKEVMQFAESEFILPTYVTHNTDSLYIKRFCATWGIDKDRLGLMWDVKEDRLVFPVKHDGVIVDATGRSLGKRLPKWKRYGKSGLPYTSGCGKVAIVVEDCVSAAVVGEDVRLVGVAMLGTSMLESHKRYLSQFSTAIIALDPDALKKTLLIAKELRGQVANVRVLKLTDDLKYRHPDDLAALAAITNEGD